MGLSDELLERAEDAFHAEYHRYRPRDGDAVDHAEAIRCGVEAVIELVQLDRTKRNIELLADTLSTPGIAEEPDRAA